MGKRKEIEGQPFPKMFTSVSHLLEYSGTVQQLIKRRPQLKTKISRTASITSIEKLVGEIAPHEIKEGAYDLSEIVGKTVKAGGPPVSYQEINRALRKLKRHGIIPKTSKRQSPKLRTATYEQIRRYDSIVQEVVSTRFRHKIPLAFQWPSYLTRDRVKDLAREAVIRGIETYNPEKGDEKTHVKIKISSAIADAIEREIQRKKMEASFRALHEVEKNDEPYSEEEALSAQLSTLHIAHQQKKLTAWELHLWALTNVFGHRNKDVAELYGTTISAISQGIKGPKKILQKVAAEQAE